MTDKQSLPVLLVDSGVDALVLKEQLERQGIEWLEVKKVPEKQIIEIVEQMKSDDNKSAALREAAEEDYAFDGKSLEEDADRLVKIIHLRFNRFCQKHEGFKALRDSIIGQINYGTRNADEGKKPEHHVSVDGGSLKGLAKGLLNSGLLENKDHGQRENAVLLGLNFMPVEDKARFKDLLNSYLLNDPTTVLGGKNACTLFFSLSNLLQKVVDGKVPVGAQKVWVDAISKEEAQRAIDFLPKVPKTLSDWDSYIANYGALQHSNDQAFYRNVDLQVMTLEVGGRRIENELKDAIHAACLQGKPVLNFSLLNLDPEWVADLYPPKDEVKPEKEVVVLDIYGKTQAKAAIDFLDSLRKLDALSKTVHVNVKPPFNALRHLAMVAGVEELSQPAGEQIGDAAREADKIVDLVTKPEEDNPFRNDDVLKRLDDIGKLVARLVEEKNHPELAFDTEAFLGSAATGFANGVAERPHSHSYTFDKTVTPDTIVEGLLNAINSGVDKFTVTGLNLLTKEEREGVYATHGQGIIFNRDQTIVRKFLDRFNTLAISRGSKVQIRLQENGNLEVVELK